MFWKKHKGKLIAAALVLLALAALAAVLFRGGARPAEDGGYTCTISISCASILNHLELCDPEKIELVPENGWILEPVSVIFY